MFPDPTVRWQPYPSVMDGIRGIFILDRGTHTGTRRLVMTPMTESLPVFVVELDCAIFLTVEELLYDMAVPEHGGWNDGVETYIREASQSRLLEIYDRLNAMQRPPVRHFCFPGLEYAVECLASAEPVIHEFPDYDTAFAWVRMREDGDRAVH
jgi:hypothetical protein